MKNQKLQMMLSLMKSNSGREIETLSSNDEMKLLGGSCPLLTSCENYTFCSPKFKDGSGSETIIKPTIQL